MKGKPEFSAKDYEALVSSFRLGKLAAESSAPKAPGGAFGASLAPVAEHLLLYNRRDWSGFDRNAEALRGPAFDEIRGDLLFLEANSRMLRSEYDRANLLYDETLRKLKPACRLANEGLVAYNQFVIRSLSQGFRMASEISGLRRIRKAALKDGRPGVQALVLNAYGEHYALRGRFRRALRVFQAAARLQEADFRLNDMIRSATNIVRMSIQTREMGEAEKWLKMLNRLVIQAGDAFFKDRYDLVYAEFLAAAERYDEALTHIDFSVKGAVPLESVRMRLLRARILMSLDRGGTDVLESLREIQRFDEEKELSEDTLVDLHVALASAHLAEGDLASAYRSIVRAEALALSLHNPFLRAEVMVQKARLNRLQGNTGSAARLLVDTLNLAHRQGFALIVLQTLRQLAEGEIFVLLDKFDRELVTGVLDVLSLGEELTPSAKAARELRAALDAKYTPAAESASGARIESSSDEADDGIYLVQSGAKGESRVLIARGHRMTGKLLLEFLKAPNRDLGIDPLHLSLWGGPVRNESHVQKLKTLVSRLRAELREKCVPLELESREYATYRAVTSLTIRLQ